MFTKQKQNKTHHQKWGSVKHSQHFRLSPKQLSTNYLSSSIILGLVRTGKWKDLAEKFSSLCTPPTDSSQSYSGFLQLAVREAQHQATSFRDLWSHPILVVRNITQCLLSSFPAPLPFSSSSCCSDNPDQPFCILRGWKSEHLLNSLCFVGNQSKESTNSWVADLLSIDIRSVKQ